MSIFCSQVATRLAVPEHISYDLLNIKVRASEPTGIPRRCQFQLIEKSSANLPICIRVGSIEQKDSNTSHRLAFIQTG